MKKHLLLASVAAFAVAAGTINAQTVIQDFEGGTTATSLGSSWGPTFSGTSSVTNGAEEYSDEQDNTTGSGLSAKLTFDWGASGTVSRIQPTTLLEAGPSDHSTEPIISISVFGANQGSEIQPYMCDTGNNAGYEAFSNPTVIDFTGWQDVEYDIDNDASEAWITGDGTLSSSNCELCGIFLLQGSAAAGADVYYLDDIQYKAATTSVRDWSVF